VAELVFFSGTMDCGKSTLALQTDHNHSSRGRAGLIFTKLDRAGSSVLSSRLGLSTAAREVSEEMDFWDLICDEAQFYTPAQVEQLARIVDEMAIDVFAFGITSDFRAQLPWVAAAHRARRPGGGPPGGGAVLVRQEGHPQRARPRRRHGGRGRAGRRR
jgi:thymidine kinase